MLEVFKTSVLQLARTPLGVSVRDNTGLRNIFIRGFISKIILSNYIYSNS